MVTAEEERDDADVAEEVDDAGSVAAAGLWSPELSSVGSSCNRGKGSCLGHTVEG